MGKLKSAMEERKKVIEMIQKVRSKEANTEPVKKEKRVRRSAEHIIRKCVCPVDGCGKSYGTEGCLAQHIKIKHPNEDNDNPPS